MKYFKTEHAEGRQEHTDWGSVIVYYETTDDFAPSRQVEIFQNGNRLKYDTSNATNQFGVLQVNDLKSAESNGKPVTKGEFDQFWNIASETGMPAIR